MRLSTVTIDIDNCYTLKSVGFMEKVFYCFFSMKLLDHIACIDACGLLLQMSKVARSVCLYIEHTVELSKNG